MKKIINYSLVFYLMLIFGCRYTSTQVKKINIGENRKSYLLEKETNRNSKIIAKFSHDGDPKVLKTQYYLISQVGDFVTEQDISKIINSYKKQNYSDWQLAMEIATKIDFKQNCNAKDFKKVFDKLKEIDRKPDPLKSLMINIYGLIRFDDIDLIKKALEGYYKKINSVSIDFDESIIFFRSNEDDKTIKIINYKTNSEFFFNLKYKDVIYFNIYNSKPICISSDYANEKPKVIIVHGEKLFELIDIKKMIFYNDASVVNNKIILFAGLMDENQICVIDLDTGKLVMQKDGLSHIDLFKEISNFQKPNQSPK